MAAFVFVSGAWHGGWCWERVVPALEAAGHRALAPDLVGMGQDAARATQGGIDVWAEQIAALIMALDEPVILTGHSRGGVVITAVAERIPERIRYLVYLTAFLLPDSRSILDFVRTAPAGRVALQTIQHEDGTSELSPKTALAALYQRTPPDWAQRAAAQLTAEPNSTATTPIKASAGRFGSVRRAYIECLDDASLAIAAQRAMHQLLPCDPVIALDSDHSPFYSQPDHLCAALDRIAQLSA